jgi:hypothetical protein
MTPAEALDKLKEIALASDPLQYDLLMEIHAALDRPEPSVGEDFDELLDSAFHPNRPATWPDTLDQKQVCEILGITPQGLKRWIGMQKNKPVHILPSSATGLRGRGSKRTFDKAQFLDWLQKTGKMK